MRSPPNGIAKVHDEIINTKRKKAGWFIPCLLVIKLLRLTDDSQKDEN